MAPSLDPSKPSSSSTCQPTPCSAFPARAMCLHGAVMLLSIHTRWVHTCTCREAGSQIPPTGVWGGEGGRLFKLLGRGACGCVIDEAGCAIKRNFKFFKTPSLTPPHYKSLLQAGRRERGGRWRTRERQLRTCHHSTLEDTHDTVNTHTHTRTGTHGTSRYDQRRLQRCHTG